MGDNIEWSLHQCNQRKTQRENLKKKRTDSKKLVEGGRRLRLLPKPSINFDPTVPLFTDQRYNFIGLLKTTLFFYLTLF